MAAARRPAVAPPPGQQFRSVIRQPAKGSRDPARRLPPWAARRAARRAPGASEDEDASACSSGDRLRDERYVERFGSSRSVSWKRLLRCVRPSWALSINVLPGPVIPGLRRQAEGYGTGRAASKLARTVRRTIRAHRARNPRRALAVGRRWRAVAGGTQAAPERSYPGSHSQSCPSSVRCACSGTETAAQWSPS